MSDWPLVGKILVHLGLLAIISAIYIEYGLTLTLVSAGVYLFITGAAWQNRDGLTGGDPIHD